MGKVSYGESVIWGKCHIVKGVKWEKMSHVEVVA